MARFLVVILLLVGSAGCTTATRCASGDITIEEAGTTITFGGVRVHENPQRSR
jgi:acetyl-CoA carboxylase beta subunit